MYLPHHTKIGETSNYITGTTKELGVTLEFTLTSRRGQQQSTEDQESRIT